MAGGSVFQVGNPAICPFPQIAEPLQQGLVCGEALPPVDSALTQPGEARAAGWVRRELWSAGNDVCWPL